MIHKTQSPLAGKIVTIKFGVKDIGGRKIEIEDWWDKVSGYSWMMGKGNPACSNYAVHVGTTGLPTNNEVVSGKIDNLGYLVHINEIEDNDQI